MIDNNSTITFDNIDYSMEDIYTEDFYQFCNNISSNYMNHSFYVNELYNIFIIPYLSIVYFIEKNDIKEVNSLKANILIKSICTDLQINSTVKYHLKGRISFVYKFYLKISSIFLQTISAFYLVYKMSLIKYRKSDYQDEDYSVVRTKAGKSKLRNFRIIVEYEDYNKIDSIYRLSPISLRIKWVIKSFICSFGEQKKIKSLINNYIGPNTSLVVQNYYSKRLVHTLLYLYVLNNYIYNNNYKRRFYTTNNLDRFSVIEEIISRKYSIESICIPHGIEFGYKFPKGFSCDKHFTTTLYSAQYLNKLYHTDKFVFDINIAEKMFKSNFKKCNNNKKVVFFTEPRDVNVNHFIIENLKPLLLQNNIELYLKLHPKDKLADYRKFNLKLIHNLDEALQGNICFARKSTTLLEAIYNNSEAAAVLLNSKDESIFKTFTSLQSEKIQVLKSIPELSDWIYYHYNKPN